MRSIVLLFACATLFMTHAAAAQSTSTLAADSAIRVGDVLRITVWRNPDLSGDFEVSGSGAILHPIYKSLNVAGLAPSEAERRIGELLTTYVTVNPPFVTEVLIPVFVAGQVRQAGKYTVSSQTRIAQTVTDAGGVTENGRTDRILLIRDGAEHNIDLEQAGQIVLQSGDQVIVEEKSNFWRNTVLPVVQGIGSLASLAVLYLRIR